MGHLQAVQKIPKCQTEGHGEPRLFFPVWIKTNSSERFIIFIIQNEVEVQLEF